MFFKLRREKVRITNLVGEGELADQMLAERFKLPKEQLVAMMSRLEKRDVSLDVPVYDSGLATLVDTLPSPDTNQEDAYLESQDQRRTQSVVRTALESLDDRERYIVEQRLMADSDQEKSLAELGRILGVSRERARQLEVRAKRKLRARIGELMEASGAEEALVHAA
jgi:RNA polymerase sigma-32 factor